MQHYIVRGKHRTYTFSIDDDAPLRRMTKRELALLYHPEASPTAAHDAFKRDVAMAHDADGVTFLADVLRDIAPCDTAKTLSPDHVAAILHYLGPPPDREDLAA
jgi:hypothetical protein